jgi:uncharacterized membrane protein
LPTEQEVAVASRALSAGLSLIATFLGLRQWYEQRARPTPLPPADAEHYARQDRRRWAGVVALGAISICALLGSRTSSRVDGKGNPAFVLIWVGVLGLILVLMVLAMTDWMATRRLALRHRKQLLRDSIDAIRRDRDGKENRPSPPAQDEGKNGRKS